MEIPCPACRKLNVVANGEGDAGCIRCGCELGPLVAIAHAAWTELQDASDALRAGDVREALKHARRSWHLRRSPQAAAAAALAAAGSGDAAALDRWRDRWTEAQASP